MTEPDFSDDFTDGNYTDKWEIYVNQGDFSVDVVADEEEADGNNMQLNVSQTTGSGTRGAIGWTEEIEDWDQQWTLKGEFYPEDLSINVPFQQHPLYPAYRPADDTSGEDRPLTLNCGFTDGSNNIIPFKIDGSLINTKEEVYEFDWQEDTWYNYKLVHDGDGRYTAKLWTETESEPDEPDAISVGGTPPAEPRVGAIQVNGGRGEPLQIQHGSMTWSKESGSNSGSEQVGASASVFSWVPGLSENDNEGWNDLYSAFPDQGPIPGLPIDEAFLGDKSRSLEETVEQTLEMQKEVQGLDGSYREFRMKNTVEISFSVDSNGEVDGTEPIELGFNYKTPENYESESRLDGENPSFEFTLLDSNNQEQLPTTILEENINEGVNFSIYDFWGWPFESENERVRTVFERPRYATATLDNYTFRGETLEGVRVANLWGTENPFAHEIAATTGPLPGASPIIYNWIDLVVLTDGTYAVRVQDAPQFPMHTLYIGQPGDPSEQYRRTDSGLEILFDPSASTNNEYAAAINEDNHKPWGQFFGSFDDNTTYVPYKTPHSRYLENHNNDSTGRWFGYQNELLVDHPIMTYGRTGDGEELSTDEILEILPEPQSPFPGLLPYSFD